MSINYQQLDRYKGSLYGSLQYNGLEYDWEAPDNQVISSPGGVSGIHHHYTKGMYSPSSSYSDIYGGETPAYVYGEHGGMYQVGHSAPYYMGDFQQPRDQMYTQNEGTLRRDNFVPGVETQPPSGNGVGGGMELIPPPDTSQVDPVTNVPIAHSTLVTAADRIKDILNKGKILTDRVQIQDVANELSAKMKNVVVLPKPWAIFVLLFLLWMSVSFLMYAGEGLITTKLHGGEPLNWKWYLFYAVIFMIALVIATKYVDISILRLEGV